jgi:DNA-binding NarL/FixJ family response regulator
MSTRKILIVEDEAVIAAHLKIVIGQLEGYEVVGVCYSAEDGLQKAAGLKPDLVLLDIRLGQGVDGIEAGVALNGLGIGFAFLTSNTDPGTIMKAMRTQPLAYIVKPFDRKGLLENLELAFLRKKKIFI